MEQKLKKSPFKIIQNNDGLTILEVMMATVLFAVFIVAFTTGQGNNVMTSIRMREDLRLKDLAQLQYNRTLLEPPDFKTPIVDEKKETKAFEDYPNYEYTFSYKPVLIPDVDKIMGAPEGENQSGEKQARARIMKEFKSNMEKLIWQIKIEVKNKISGNTFEISGWTYFPEANVQFKGI
jgi:hypothetical protein